MQDIRQLITFEKSQYFQVSYMTLFLKIRDQKSHALEVRSYVSFKTHLWMASYLTSQFPFLVLTKRSTKREHVVHVFKGRFNVWIFANYFFRLKFCVIPIKSTGVYVENADFGVAETQEI